MYTEEGDNMNDNKVWIGRKTCVNRVIKSRFACCGIGYKHCKPARCIQYEKRS